MKETSIRLDSADSARRRHLKHRTHIDSHRVQKRRLHGAIRQRGQPKHFGKQGGIEKIHIPEHRLRRQPVLLQIEVPDKRFGNRLQEAGLRELRTHQKNRGRPAARGIPEMVHRALRASGLIPLIKQMLGHQ